MAAGEPEADGVVGVVGDGEALDLEIAEAKARAGFEELPFRLVAGIQLGLHGAGGGGVGKDADARKFFQALDAGGMVAVFVGEEDRVDVFERFARGGEELAEFADGKARIDEDARALGDEQGAVARAAATEDGKTHGHVDAS